MTRRKATNKVALLLLSALLTTTKAFVVEVKSRAGMSLNMMSTTETTTPQTCRISDALALTLKKPSKTLSVLLECSKGGLSKEELDTLSMQLRKLKTSGLVTNDLEVAIRFVQEQAAAVGNFPGPCPVVYAGSDVEGAARVGVSAVIVDASPSDDTNSWHTDMDFIVKIDAPEDFVLAPRSNAYMVNGDSENIKEILDSLPSDAIVIAQVEAMQSENMELQSAKALKELGVHCILVQNACVGDAEDLEYSSFVIDGLTKKKSSTFNMSGLTGATNGHFGGIASTQPVTWRRKRQ